MRALIIPALVLAFTVYCLVDVVRSDDSDVRGLPKLVWVLLVLLFPLAGGVAWLIAGRPRRSRLPGTGRLGRPAPRVLGPDDDPDFLRGLDRGAQDPPEEPGDRRDGDAGDPGGPAPGGRR
ncbi:PLDc N-terminal domain-containing protein [Aquipuribacter nitratireducens]|uniref:PLDc N-terminal domain-containing protein n=1 Tax=Aquipuribacter nitratireducens TaxID=650104 RepID=A0ABW0GNF7_9MICO